MASSFICARDPGRAGQRTGLDTLLQLGTVGSKVNSDFLFILKDLRLLWFPVAYWCVCALVSVCLRRAANGVSVSLHSAFHEKIRILQSLIVGRFHQVL